MHWLWGKLCQFALWNILPRLVGLTLRIAVKFFKRNPDG